MMQRNSLAFRLAASAATVSLVLLVAAGILLGYLFREAVESNFDARLQAVLDGLLANVELDDSARLTMPGAIADTRFNLPLSGWYWQITQLGDTKHDLVSASLLDQRLQLGDITVSPRDKAGIARVYLTDSEGTRLRAIEQRYTLFGSKHQFSFVVAGNFDELRGEISAFENALFIVLGVSWRVGLLIAVLAQVRYAMGPLRLLQSELTSIREGQSDTLNEQYPLEIQPVAHELNLLVKSNTEVVERARTQVGNLAHALKTPLSVLSNEAETNSAGLATKVREQTQVMRDQVNMYLDRARRAARARSLGAASDPKESGRRHCPHAAEDPRRPQH